MLKKSNDVLHFNLKPSKALSYFQKSLYIIATLLVLFCSLDWFFKVLLLMLLALEYLRQKTIAINHNFLKEIEIRDTKIFIKRKNDNHFELISKLNIKQNRIFAELKLQLKDESQSEFLCGDSFDSKSQFSLLMQNLRLNHQ